MLKACLFLGFIALCLWFFFWRKPKKGDARKGENQDLTGSMVECRQCKTFILQNEALISNGFYYCSRDCLTKERT